MPNIFRFLFLLTFCIFQSFAATRNPYVEMEGLYAQYKAVPIPIIHQWGPKTTNPIDALHELPEHLKPRLPQGFIWGIGPDNRLILLQHEALPVVNFTIYFFGKDDKGRYQYLVVEDGKPIQGFAMTRSPGFPDMLRGTYPMAAEDYKKGKIINCRGHITDYKDTLGKDTDPTISTLLALNYKPEPWGYWARTLRTWLVGEIREAGGSYMETIFYPFNPDKTFNKTPIPVGVNFEEFTAAQTAKTAYLVPWDHACHGWTARDHTTEIAAGALASLKKARPIVWDRSKTGATQKAVLDLFNKSLDFVVADFVDAHHLQLAAETEYDSASTKLAYLIYAVQHKASLETVTFWTRRAAKHAQLIDDLYTSIVPAFGAAQLNTLRDVLKAETLSDHMEISSSFNVLVRVYDHMMEGRLTLKTLFEHPDEKLVVTPVKPRPKAPKVINVSGGKTTKAITPEVEAAAGAGDSIELAEVSTAKAKELAAAFTKYNATHPTALIRIKSVIFSHVKWEKGVRTALAPFFEAAI